MTTLTISKVQQVGTGATNRIITDKLNEVVSVRDFGAVGDGTTNDTAAIQTCFTAAAVIGAKVVIPATSTGYLITDTLTLTTDLDMTGAELWYNGTRDRAAMVVGTTGTIISQLSIRGLFIRGGGFTGASAISWPSANFVGVKSFGLHQSQVELAYIGGFNIGWWLYADTTDGSAYNAFYGGRIENCQVGLQLSGAGATSNHGWVNENKFFALQFEQRSTTNALGDAYGIKFSWDKSNSYRSQNNNFFFGLTFELQTPGSTRIPVWHDGAGAFNRFVLFRHETGSGAFALCDGGSTASIVIENTYEAGYTSVAGGVTQQNLAYNNTYKPYQGWVTGASWHSGQVESYLSGRVANTPYISGPFHFVQNSTTIAKTANNSSLDYGYEGGQFYLKSSNSALGVGVFIDTNVTKKFVVTEDSVAGFPGRLMVQCYDAAGAVLSGSSPSYVQLSGTAIAATANFGNAYIYQTDTFTAGLLNFDAAVKFARIGFVGGSNPLKLKSFNISAVAEGLGYPLQVYANLPDDLHQKLSSAKPDTAGEFGSYAIGNVVFNSGAAAGQPSHWACSTAGRLAKQWVTLTAYVVGQVRYLGANVYVCTVAGTSGATGPVGTGTGIVDGTATWDFLTTKAVFVTASNLA